MSPLLDLDLPGRRKIRSGKVREMFDLGDCLLLVATDRISAFDCVMPNGIPGKGTVLTQLSHFWFDQMSGVIPNHRLTGASGDWPAQYRDVEASVRPRAMLVRKAVPLPIECVVRGYLAGSGWKEYVASRTICGLKLPPGLVEASRLPEPVFTPATKAESGHDENIPFERATELIGKEAAVRVREASLEIYRRASEYALTKGIIIADTKFEFGYWNNELILIDEVLTPDSSRFWPADSYQAGRNQASFDKQFVRDYLETLSWDKRPPAPALPAEVVHKTAEKYHEAYRRLTGHPL